MTAKNKKTDYTGNRGPFGVGKLSESPIKSGAERFAFKSAAIKDKVVRELNLKKEDQRTEAAYKIAVELHEYRIRVVNDLHNISDSSEKARAGKASKHLRDAIAAMEVLGRDAHLNAFFPTLASNLRHPTTPDEFYNDLIEVAESLEDFVRSVKPQRGREPLDTLDDFVSELAYIYRHATGRPAGFSSKPVVSQRKDEGHARAICAFLPGRSFSC